MRLLNSLFPFDRVEQSYIQGLLGKIFRKVCLTLRPNWPYTKCCSTHTLKNLKIKAPSEAWNKIPTDSISFHCQHYLKEYNKIQEPTIKNMQCLVSNKTLLGMQKYRNINPQPGKISTNKTHTRNVIDNAISRPSENSYYKYALYFQEGRG